MILLDTHVVIWLALDPKRISRKAEQTIREARDSGGLAICSLSLFEIAHLIVKGRIEVSMQLEAFLQEIEARFVLTHVTSRIAALSTQLPQDYPGEPIDRLIGATAIAERMPLVTADERIRKARAVQTIW